MNRTEYINNFIKFVFKDLCMWFGVCMVAVGINLIYTYSTVYDIVYHFVFVIFFYLISIPVVYVFINGLPVSDDAENILKYEKSVLSKADRKL